MKKRSMFAQLAVLVAFLAAFFTQQTSAQASPPEGQIERVTTDAYGKKVSDNVVAVEIGRGVGFDTIKRMFGPGFKTTTGRDLTAMDIFSVNKEQVFPACLTGRKKKPVRGDASVWKDCPNEADQTIGLMAGPTGRLVIPTVKARSFGEVEAALAASEACDRDVSCLQRKLGALVSGTPVDGRSVTPSNSSGALTGPPVMSGDELNEAYIHTLEDQLNETKTTLTARNKENDRLNWLVNFMIVLLLPATLFLLGFAVWTRFKLNTPKDVSSVQALSLPTVVDHNRLLQERVAKLEPVAAMASTALEKLKIGNEDLDRERANFAEELSRLQAVEGAKFDLDEWVAKQGEVIALQETELDRRAQREIDLETANEALKRELGELRSWKAIFEPDYERAKQDLRDLRGGKRVGALRRPDRTPTPPNGQPAFSGPVSGQLSPEEVEEGASSAQSPPGEADEVPSGKGRLRKLTLLPPPDGNAAVPPPTNGAGHHVSYSSPPQGTADFGAGA